MVDSGEDLNISVEAIRRAITPKTKAIIPVDIAGYP
jgi:dTDP-4-amino-4,6-dideoxygalactose transaminase